MDNYADLYKKLFNQECSREEAEILLKYFKSSKGDEELVKWIESILSEQAELVLTPEDMDAIARNSVVIESVSTSKLYKLKKWIPYAAAAAVLFCTTLFFLLKEFQGKSNQERQVNFNVEDISPGGNRAILKIANGRAIALSETKKNITIGYNEILYGDGKEAIVLLNNAHKSNPDTITISTPNGGTYQVSLPDGSRISLNAATTIKYIANTGKDNRVVFLEGEAFFDVATKYKTSSKSTGSAVIGNDSRKVPFKVISKNQEIEVLGTQFNVSAYEDESRVKTTLVEGTVQVKTTKFDKLLKPGEQASTHGYKIDIKKVDTQQYTGWKDGFFYFDKSATENVLAQLARWYDLDIAYQGQIPKVRVFGIIDRNKPLGSVLKSLEKSGLKFKVTQLHGKNKLTVLGE